MGSPLYGAILDRCATGEDGGAVLSLLRTRPATESVISEAIVLRLLAAVHRLALAGRAPALAAAYPSCGGNGSVTTAWPAFVSTVEEHRATIECELELPLQTNEIGRAAALLGGFLSIVERFGMPLRLLEIGASAGLLLRWDRFRYEADTWSWGPADAAVRLTKHFAGDGLPFSPDRRVEIGERRGCDTSPIDPTTRDGRRRLLSFIWPDDAERIARLDAACELAGTVEASVERANAPQWLERRLRAPRPGCVTVVYHTVVMQYLSLADRHRLATVLDEAGRRAVPEAPLAHLSLEPRRGDEPNVVLRTWPGDRRYDLAHATMHGRDVRWLQSS